MNFDALKFYSAHGIDNISSGHKRARPGWIQSHCPFCRGIYALGYHQESGAYNCWKCGRHGQLAVIQAILHCSANQAHQILQQYNRRPILRPGVGEDIKPQLRRECKWPDGTATMTDRHRQYLVNRKFVPELLERTFNLKGTGPVGDYLHRIILPIYLDRKMISFQGRDITGKCEDHDKYRACAKVNEALDHKHSLYAIDLVPGDAAVVVEGAADVWRLGPGAVGTFGTGFTRIQQLLFRRRFKQAFMLFDPEPIAMQKAEQCAYELAIIGIKVELIELDEADDPGNLKQDDADYIMRELLGRGAGWN